MTSTSLAKKREFGNRPNYAFFWDGAFVILVILILPSLIGLLLVFSYKNKRCEAVRSRFHVSSTDLLPTAWDFYFSQKKPCWIIIVTNDDKHFGGVYSKKSFASDYSDKADIYIEQLWDIDYQNRDFLEPIHDSKGGYFTLDQIKHIEFF